jgi:hypothetical protein
MDTEAKTMAISHATRRAPSIQPSLPLLPLSIIIWIILSSYLSNPIRPYSTGSIGATLKAPQGGKLPPFTPALQLNHKNACRFYPYLSPRIARYGDPGLAPRELVKQKECQALKLAQKKFDPVAEL